MTHLLISSSITVFFYYIFGTLISNNLKSSTINLSKNIIHGAILTSFISLLLNFFTPLTKEVNSLAFLIILFFIIIYSNFNPKHKLYISKKHFIFLVLISSITYILLFASHTYRPDAGLYHLPFVKILNSEKIIFGLANLHFRFGHTSIIQYLSAINFNLITGINGIGIPSAIIASAVILNLFSKFKFHVVKKQYNFHFYYLLGILIYIFLKMNRYSEFGNDAPAHYLTFYFFSEFLKIKKNDLNIDKLLNISFVALFIVLNKITLILIFIIPTVLIIKNKFFVIFKKFKFYLILIFGLSWIIKNIIMSGCLIYPVKITCYENLAWTDIKTVENISLENEAFSKNWPNYERRQEITKTEYVKNFNWFKNWIKKLLDEQKEKSFAYFLILFLIFIYLRKKTNKINNISNKNMLFLFTVLTSTILWFVKFPDYRYAYSVIIILITYPFALLLCNRIFINNPNKFFSTIIIICFSVFILKNFIRIYNTSFYFNYPYPRIYSHNDDNEKLNYNLRKIDNVTTSTQKNGYCMYGENLCSPYEVDITIKNKNGYMFFLNNL